MKNKNILITGGNAGIGFETALALAKMQANVYIVCRNEEKAMIAVNELKSKSGNEQIDFFVADLSSQKSIKKLCAAIFSKISVIDVLINNAGAVFPNFALSEDGLEMTIATNHFSFYQLTNLLIPLIKKSDYARIVNVSSESNYQGKIDLESFTKEKGYFILKAYAQSKLANVFFTQEMAERLKNSQITINCLHPGRVKTDIGNKETNWYSSFTWTLVKKFASISIADGAKTSVFLATSPDVKGVSGKYFDRCKATPPSKLALNKALQKALWDYTQKMCPLS